MNNSLSRPIKYGKNYSIFKRRRKLHLSKEAEEYLEAIYRLEEKYGYARTMDLAKELRVVPGSITNTIENFERIGFVEHIPYKGVKLTIKGKKIALKVLRKHRLSERLLTDILKIDWCDVHKEACIMEHGITERIAKRIEEILNYPKICPHGKPIPNSSGKIIKEFFKTLNEIDCGQFVEIIGIKNEEKKILNYLSSLGIIPGILIQVLDKNLSNIYVKIDFIKKECAINKHIASNILVKPKEV
ncbi:MAG: metal-dependent transcriptional regulator [Nitrososphaerota archaeon]